MKIFLFVFLMITSVLSYSQDSVNFTNPKIDSLIESRISFLNEILVLRDSLDNNQGNVKYIQEILANKYPLEIEAEYINFFENLTNIQAKELFLAGAQGKKLDKKVLKKWQKWVDFNSKDLVLDSDKNRICFLQTGNCINYK